MRGHRGSVDFIGATPPCSRPLIDTIVGSRDVWISEEQPTAPRGAFSEPRRAGASRTKCLCVFASFVNSYYVRVARSETPETNDHARSPIRSARGAPVECCSTVTMRARVLPVSPRAPERALYSCALRAWSMPTRLLPCNESCPSVAHDSPALAPDLSQHQRASRALPCGCAFGRKSSPAVALIAAKRPGRRASGTALLSAGHGS